MESLKKILVIDDDLDIGIVIQLLLEYRGYEVFLVESAEQAGEIIRNSHIDLVILDMLLSGSNGIDYIAGFKSDTSMAHVPVMMMSAHPDAKKICMQAGADDYISKPFDMQEILFKKQ